MEYAADILVEQGIRRGFAGRKKVEDKEGGLDKGTRGCIGSISPNNKIQNGMNRRWRESEVKRLKGLGHVVLGPGV